ncbi:unnamed protein product [Discosporangium mesarthrocarpum]
MAAGDVAGEQEGALVGGSDRVVAGDELESAVVLRVNHRVRSFDFSPSMSRDSRGCRVLVALHNNSLELWGLEDAAMAKEKRRKGREGESGARGGAGEGAKVNCLAVLDMHGHRSDVRAVAVSSDNTLVASVSHGLAKVWSSRTKHCVRSVPCGFGLSVVFAPGDRHLMIGTKEGSLQVIDLGSGDMLRDYDAHEGAVWSLDLRPDGKGLVTGSADRQVKFWDFEVVSGNLGLVHTRSLKMADDVLCVRYSRHKQESKLLVAVAILDSTVKVFHDDSLKFFLSLYGHKLPVMSMDISDDGTLIATGSADKTLKIWGLDFGDCHRSLLAHDDSVMSVRFVPGTHYLFTCSKDRTIRHWDADHFEKILELRGHQAEAWAMEVSKDGSYVLSGGHDRSLRLWRRGEDMVFLEEEREKELEGLFESELGRDDQTGGGRNAPGVEGERAPEDESGPATKRSLETVKAGERLMETLELADEEEKLARAQARAVKRAAGRGGGAPPERRPNPLLLNLSPLRYVLRTLQMIKAPELEQALLVLPFTQVESLARYLARLLAEGLEVELCARCAIFLLRVHQAQIVANRTMVGVLDLLRTHLRQQLEASRDTVGRNMAGLKLLSRSIESEKNAYVMETEEDRLAKKMRR